MDNETLINLVRQSQAGDTEAFGLFYDACFTLVYRYVLARTGSVPDAEDVTEETFLKAWRALPRFKMGGAPVTAWLLTIAKNATADHHRRRGARRETPVEHEDLAAHPDAAAPARLTEGLEAEELARLLAGLTEDQRSVLIYRFVLGMPIAVVAAQSGKSEEAVKALQHRALASLKKTMEKNDERL